MGLLMAGFPLLPLLPSPVYRRTKRVSVALPDSFAGREVQLYGMVCSADVPTEEAEPAVLPKENSYHRRE